MARGNPPRWNTTKAGPFFRVSSPVVRERNKGTGTTHGAHQPLFGPGAILRHVLSAILAANSTPKKMPIAAPKMTPIKIITPVTCVPSHSPHRQLEGLQKVFAAVYCQAVFC
jgi:hypothetical protein